MCPDDPGHGDPRILSRTENFGHFGGPNTASRGGEGGLDESSGRPVDTGNPRLGKNVRHLRERHDAQIENARANVVATTLAFALALDPDLGRPEDGGDTLVEIEIGSVDRHHPASGCDVLLERPHGGRIGIDVDHVDPRRKGCRQNVGKHLHVGSAVG